ncbi:MAG: hypothetical protein KKB20_17015, partial [Proteobacteria bacterium]|nr:hypothetical protein [Pseudomonadota bacterium]
FGLAADENGPTSLRDRDLEPEGQERAEGTLAWLNQLPLERGYGLHGVPWSEETPTRLGAPMTVLRLARWDGRRLTPWWDHDEGMRNWHLSEVSVRRNRVVGIVPPRDSGLDEAMTAALEQMADGGKWRHLTPLRESGDDSFTAEALSGRGEVVRLTYHPRFGLKMETGS